MRELAKTYEDWHWSIPPKKVIRVKDHLIPDIVAIGKLVSFTLDEGREIGFPSGSWIGFNPKHPHERIHLVIPERFREKLRKDMKNQKRTTTLQAIAESTGGTQARYKLPNLRAVPVGVVTEVIYSTVKGGDGWSNYVHTFGEEHSAGVQPILAIDVRGAPWLVGGSYRNPLPGITG